ncbi:S41 family peptidase [Chitinispirillales bacterium ANBcel5]|uniref:S41 family peptidase n=1 Tax=Cellulosispirillum alkaliphilum TaxID=3039283 RepID=UPI002A51597F|nr:S41 family peptidase [Chitinispirillales bacterium ANBcel5]
MVKVVFALLIIQLLYSCNSLLGPDPEHTPVEAFETIWKEIDYSYAYFDRNDVSWDSLYNLYRPMVNENTTREELNDILDEMLGSLNDKHLVVIDYSFTEIDSAQFEEMFGNLPPYDHHRYYFFPKRWGNNWIQSVFITGRIMNANVGYIYIPTMESYADTYSELATIMDSIIVDFAETEGIIIDIRGNGGGKKKFIETVAARFVDTTRNYAKSRFRNGPGHNSFTDYNYHTVTPSKNPYRKPVVLLTDSSTGSAAEWFTVALRECPHVIHAGSKTAGTFGSITYKWMPYDYLLSVTVAQVKALDVPEVQGYGIDPHVTLEQRFPDHPERDSMIEDAIELIREHSSKIIAKYGK